ncbi:MAG TPA: FAD-dependent oxidoreductase [Gemmatimonadaceae bacterium]|nr:FAD-dependent oxidoreductase [Gemmatimonadaceae bacterium]
MNNSLVLIVGGGPTGLVLALFLTRLGVRVRVIDKAPEPGTTSRALAVQARTLEFYHQTGLADAVVAGGVKVETANLWVHGRRATSVPLSRFGEGLSPYPFALVFPQDAHERLLVEQLQVLGVRVERRTELIGFTQDSDSVTATLRRADGTQEICHAAYLAGCDGASSVVREQIHAGFPGGTYSGLFYVADVEATGPVTDGQLHVDLEDADFVLVFPLKGAGRLRLVGNVSDAAPGDRALTLETVRGKAIEHLALKIAKVNWFSTYRVHHRVADRFREGRAFLLGDAAHVHSPVGGQGMNTGIGDAVNLAWKLAAVLKGATNERLLDTYEPERIAFARRLVDTTDRAFTIVTSRGPLARFVRTRIVPRIAPILFTIGATRRFMFRTLSQIGVSYQQSRLSVGKAGTVHGGDRLPWVELAEGQDNFAPLTSLAWQVHVYGSPGDGIPDVCTALGLRLHVFAWQSRMRAAGLQERAVYLIRPDGYVAVADPKAEPEVLRQYFSEQLNRA